MEPQPAESFVAYGLTRRPDEYRGVLDPSNPLFALSALAAVVAATMQRTPNVMLIASAACAVTVVAWTLIYFRPTVARFLEQQGGNVHPERLQAEARRRSNTSRERK